MRLVRKSGVLPDLLLLRILPLLLLHTTTTIATTMCTLGWCRRRLLFTYILVLKMLVLPTYINTHYYVLHIPTATMYVPRTYSLFVVCKIVYAKTALPMFRTLYYVVQKWH